MNVAFAPPISTVRLAAGESHALSDAVPATLSGGPADLFMITPGSPGGRFVATLPPQTLLPGAPAAATLFIRARRPASVTPGGTSQGARPWLEALSRALPDHGGETAEPDGPEAFAAATERLLEAIARHFAEEERPAEAEGAATGRDDKAYANTLNGFRLLLAQRFRRRPAAALSPLAGAAAQLAALRQARPVAIREQPGETREEFLDRFAAAHGLRMRRIRTDAGEVPEGDGPFLVFDEAGRPLLLTPRARGGYRLEDPGGEAAPRPFDAAQWRLLSADAFTFYRTLPAGKLSWREILGFGLRDSAWDFAFLGLCGVIGAGLALLPPIASAQIANIAVHTADTGFLIDLLMVLALALVAETTFHVVGHLAELRAQGRSGLALHAAMVDRLLRLTPAALRSSTTLILATQMETVEKFRRAMIGFAAAGTLALVNGLAAALLVAFISPMAGLVAIGLVALLLAIACLIGWAQFRAIYEGERMDVVVLAFVYDLVRLIPVIRAGHREKRAFTQWSENFLAFQSRIMRSTRLSNRLAVLEPLWEALTLALCFAALAYAGSRIELGAGEAIVFVMALGRLMRAGRELAHTLLGASKLMPMAKLSQSLIEQRIDPLVSGVRVPSLSGSIDMTGVSFFHGERRILGDVDLSIAPGEFVGLAGPSGSGKSTLLALLSGLERPQSGRVLLGGYELAALDRRQIAGQIGMVMQNSRLFPGSIFQNIRGVSEIGLDEAWHFAELAGIAEELRRFPMGLQTIVVEGGSGLATGQAQRILIARALAKKPAVLVLDEAMSALDGASQQRILETLSRLPLTRILVSHRPSTLAKADRIVVLQRGAIVDDGPPEAIMRRQPLFHAHG